MLRKPLLRQPWKTALFWISHATTTPNRNAPELARPPKIQRKQVNFKVYLDTKLSKKYENAPIPWLEIVLHVYKIVGIAPITPYLWPLYYRLIQNTTTLQSLDPPKISTTFMSFKVLFYLFIVENNTVYVKKYIVKMLQLLPSVDCGGYRTP